MNFTYTLVTHGMEITLNASDADLLTIPRDALCAEQPRFVIEAPRLAGMQLRERHVEEQFPSPPSIFTEHLRPHNLSVRWIRGQEPATFTYEIVLK